MLFLSRQEVVSIMNEYKEECDKRISRIEEEQKEISEYRVKCEIMHKQGEEHRIKLQDSMDKLSESNLTLAASIDNMTTSFHDTWIKSRNAWITGETLLKLSAVVVAFIAAYIAIKDVI